MKALYGEAPRELGKVGFPYGWYLAADSGLSGGFGYPGLCNDADENSECGFSSGDAEDVATPAPSDPLVCVLKCCSNSSLVTNLFPQ